MENNQLKSFKDLNVWKKAADKKGFSLLEVLIYIGILGIVTLAITQIFISVNSGRGRTESVNEVNSNLRFAADKIEQDLRYASSISTPASAGATSTSLVINSSTSTIIYCQAGIQFKRQLNGSCTATSSDVISTAVALSSLVFTRLENVNSILAKTIVSIKVDMVINYNSSSTASQYSGEKITTISLK